MDRADPRHDEGQRLDENLGATRIELDADDLRAIDAALATVAVQGARYPEHLLRRVDR